jgi:hypothetical protein
MLVVDGAAGGSGIIIVKTNPASGVNASGVWPINDAYNYKKQGTWTNAGPVQ